MDLLFFLIPFSVSVADFSKPSSFCLEICLKNPSILRSVTAFKGMWPSLALHNIFGVDLFTPRICLQKFKWTCSIGDFPMSHSLLFQRLPKLLHHMLEWVELWHQIV